MNKKKIFALIPSFSILFSTSMTSMATEIGQIDDYADMKSGENSVSYQDITSAVNTGGYS